MADAGLFIGWGAVARGREKEAVDLFNERLASIRVSEEFTRYTIRAGLVVENFGVVGADLAARLQQQMAFYMEQIGAIA
jgi:hypothetical protein